MYTYIAITTIGSFKFTANTNEEAVLEAGAKHTLLELYNISLMMTFDAQDTREWSNIKQLPLY